MTPEKVALVQGSWKLVVPIADQAAELFYNRLFELDPSVKPLFKTELKEQGRKLTSMINTVVVGLDKIETLAPAIEDLGRRHVGYGVTDAHYDTVGQALLWTLSTGLGEAFTEETEEAWTEAYTLLATVMKQAAAAEVA